MIPWPESLVIELAERRVIPVLGAGVSATARTSDGDRPPTWTDFLEGLRARMVTPDLAVLAERLLEEGRLLDAAEIVRSDVPTPDFSRFIREALLTPAFEPSEWHRLIQRLDAKVVVTLNYDDIYERQCRRGKAAASYSVHSYTNEHILNGLRSDLRLIIKAHGCGTEPERIVLTRRSYFASQRDFRSFHSLLESLFLTSTLLFLGCGFNDDPDIQLALQNVVIAAPSTHPHYAVIDERHPDAVFRAMREAYNVDFLRYSAGDHHAALDSLRDLVERVEARRYAQGAVA